MKTAMKRNRCPRFATVALGGLVSVFGSNCVVLPVDDVVPTKNAVGSAESFATGAAGTSSRDMRPSPQGNSIAGGPGPIMAAEPLGDTGVRIDSRTGVGFVPIRGGTFTMGSPPNEQERSEYEAPQHQVTISAFELGETEVTNAQYARFLEQASGVQKPALWSDSAPQDEPVTGVTWDEARQFASWAGGRLPTEAEWEYAARAGSTGGRYGSLDAVAWYSENSMLRKHPVREKQRNDWSLYDMLGNVWEWCADWYGAYNGSSSVDPVGPAQGSNRVLRGGSYAFEAQYARAPYRFNAAPAERYNFFGFRVARDLTGTR